MKFIIRQILIALALIAIIHESKCEYEFKKTRLSRVFVKIIEENNKQYEDAIENKINQAYDMDCVKNFFNLPQNDKMMVNEVEEMFFTIGSGMKCSDADKLFENQFDGYVRLNSLIKLSCFKWHLQQQEPTSKLVENFNISETDREECKKDLPLEEILKVQQMLESMVGPLNVYTCGAVSENGTNDFIIFFTKGAIIKNDDISEELKKLEKQKLKEYLKDISIRTVNCIIKRYEDDPQAFLINDTLNYFFKKELIPINPEEKDKQVYNKLLIKLEETIDYECVKEKLNLQEFGDKSLLKVEATIVIASAKSQCIKVNPLEFSNLFIDFAVDDFQRSNRPFSCARNELQKLDPTSKLAVTSISDDTYDKICKFDSLIVHPFEFTARSYKEQVGRLNETTCGLVTDEYVDVISLKTLLLLNENDKELKINETKKLFDEISEKLQKLADCILKRIK